MRKLMWLTIGIAASCAIYAYVFCEGLRLVAFIALLSCLGVACIPWRKDVVRPAIAVLLGASLGAFWFAGYEDMVMSHARQAHGQIRDYQFVCSDYSYATSYGTGVDGKVTLGNRSFSVRIYVNDTLELAPGDKIQGSFLIRMRGENGDKQQRGDLYAYQKSHITVEPSDKVPLRFYSAVIRRNLIAGINAAFPEDTAFFARALLLGDRTGVDYQTNTSFKISGISHIIAVSGLHVSILFSLVYLFSGKRRVLTALIGIPVVVLFAAVAGFSPSVSRACLMQILMMLSLLLDREYDSPTALAFAALVMMLANPMVITSVSFQLSVGCMCGIFLFSERIRNWIEGFSFWKQWKGKSRGGRMRAWFACGCAVTLSAMVFTTPLVGLYFGAVSLVGVITNLLTLWVISLIFYGIMGCCLLSFLWSGGAVILGWIVSWPIRYVLLVSRWLSRIPLAAVYTCSEYIVMWLVFCYMLLAVFLVFRKRQPYVMVCCVVLGLGFALFASWMQPLQGICTVTVLDVGQGQCVLLQADGKTFVVDCGGDSDSETADIAAEKLLSQGISKVDGLILTHYDRDHAGAVEYFLSRVPADTVYLPEVIQADPVSDSVLKGAGDASVVVVRDLELCWEDNTITVFAPVIKKSDNESGLSVLFHGGNCDILITGDMSDFGERVLVFEKEIQELTALVAGHHGAKSSTGEALLAAASPEYVFISVGKDNPYGHPDDSVLERLEQWGCQVFRTDENGDITFRR